MRSMGLKQVRHLYNSTNQVWPLDPWHQNRKRTIHTAVASHIETLPREARILNIGSADEVYSDRSISIVNLDIAEKKLQGQDIPVCASGELLPFRDEAFDLCICVGSTINYCDAHKVIREISRILFPGGNCFIEFNSSASGEYLCIDGYGAHVNLKKIEYKYDESEIIKLFSPKYIRSLLHTENMSVVSTIYIHVISSIVQRIFGNWAISGKFSVLDKLFRNRAIASRLAANVLMFCKKEAFN